MKHSVIITDIQDPKDIMVAHINDSTVITPSVFNTLCSINIHESKYPIMYSKAIISVCL